MSRWRSLLASAPLLLLAARPGAGAPQPEKPAAPPAPLSCLARYYGVTPERHDGAWFARLPDGRVLPYDDGRAKTFVQRLEQPDLEDMFALPWRGGPVRPVSTPDDDPGRVRVEALFEARYGASAGAIDLVSMPLLGARLRVHRTVAPAFARVAANLARVRAADPTLAPFLVNPGGTFVWRPIAGTSRRSSHAYGIAVDLNPRRCEYWRWQGEAGPIRWRNRVPQAIVDAFEKEGFIWGGRWFHYDTMHFEYRPELIDPGCAPGISGGPAASGTRAR